MCPLVLLGGVSVLKYLPTVAATCRAEAAMSGVNNNPTERALEGWKEIAAYLNRDARTVRRWEKTESLPVRRYLHQARSSVYALPSELTAWKEAREPQATQDDWIGWWHPRPAFGLACAILLLLISFRGGPLADLSAQAQTRPGPTIANVYNGVDLESDGSVSPDGKSFVDIDWTTGNVRVRDLESGQMRYLTNSKYPAFGEYPKWAPDGKRIAYSFCESDYARCELRIVAAGDGRPDTAYRNDVQSIEAVLDWSPNGENILCGVGESRKGALEVFSVADRRLTKLRSFSVSSYFTARYSPDGKTVVLEVPERGKVHLALISTESRSETELGNGENTERAPIWSRDGSKVFFVSNRSGQWDLWSIAVRDGKPDGTPHLVYSDIGDVWQFAGWVDDRTLLYNKDSYAVNGGDFQSVAIDPTSGTLAGEPKSVIPYFIGRQRSARWSPDGRRVAFIANGSEPKLYVYDKSNGSLREVPTRDVPGFGLGRWHPSGEALAVWSAKLNGVPTLYRLSLDGKAEEVYRRDARMRGAGHLSNDWTMASYGCAQSPQGQSANRLCIYDLKGHRMVKEVAAAAGRTVTATFVSPDDKTVFYVESSEGVPVESRIMAVPTGAGEPRVVTVVKGRVPFLNAAPDGQYLLYGESQSGTAKTPPKISLIPTSGGTQQSLTLSQWDHGVVLWSPDGKQIGYQTAEHKEQWLTLTNFLSQ